MDYDGYRNSWKNDYDITRWKDLIMNKVKEEEYDYDWEGGEAASRYDYESMLRRVMTELRSTGADTFAVLKDEELGEWWTKEVKKIEHEEAVEAAKVRASNSLSAKERKLLGLDF